MKRNKCTRGWGRGLNGNQSAAKPPGAASSQQGGAREGRLTTSLQRTQIIPPFPAESDPHIHFSFSFPGDYRVWSTHWQVFGARRVFIQYHKKPRRLWNGVWWEGTCSHFQSPLLIPASVFNPILSPRRFLRSVMCCLAKWDHYKRTQ